MRLYDINVIQGHLKKWTGHFKLPLSNQETTWDIITKVLAVLQIFQIRFLTKVWGVAWKISLPRPFEDLWNQTFRNHSFHNFWEVDISKQHKWWKFGFEISNHFSVFQISRLVFFSVIPSREQNTFWNLFRYLVVVTESKTRLNILFTLKLPVKISTRNANKKKC